MVGIVQARRRDRRRRSRSTRRSSSRSSRAADGKLRFDVGTPTTYVDIIDEGIEGANQLSNAQFEAIVSFALSRIVAVGSGSVGAIPLPAIGGVGVRTSRSTSEHGYLIVDGEVQ